MDTLELTRPLDDAERAELRSFLDETDGPSYTGTCGFLAAIAIAPCDIPFSMWIIELLDVEALASREHAKRLLDLVMRLYTEVVEDVHQDRLSTPSPDDEAACAAWAGGYFKAARLDAVWSRDDAGLTMLYPFAILAGDAPVVGLEDSEGKIIEDPSPQLRRCREVMSQNLRDTCEYWVAWRRLQEAIRETKVGRNEPCPCGGGRKFKKCCGAAS